MKDYTIYIFVAILGGCAAIFNLATMARQGEAEARLTRLEALHENEKGAADKTRQDAAESPPSGHAASGSPAVRVSTEQASDAAPASRKGYTSTHDMMLDKFDVEQHNHGKTACTYHLGGYRFTFKWDGERWEQVEAVKED